MNRVSDSKQLDNFSLVLGGPLYQLFIRARLGTDTLGLLRRRVIVITSFTWLPLLLLSLLPVGASEDAVKIPFFYDIEVHIRFLLALPLMLVAELVVHLRLQPLIRQFIERRIIAPESLQLFEAHIGSALRLRNSILIEILLIILVFTGGHYLWLSQAVTTNTWFSVTTDGHDRLTAAGFWYAYVSIPVFQMILIRWYFRIFIWAWFLWRVSRMALHLVPTHPDRAGGLGFLAGSVAAFLPLLLAQGVLVAGMIANHIFYGGASLLDFKIEVATVVVFALLLVLGPLCTFAACLAQARRQGLLEYGALASRYVREFERKWLRGEAPQDEPLVGSGDIQSLNDLAGSFEVVYGMRLLPFGKTAILQIVVTTLLPMLPLSLTLISLEDLAVRLIGILL